MTIKFKGTACPPELEAAVIAHAAASVAGDDCGAAAFVSGRAQDAFGAVLQRASSMRPFDRYEVIARARLGFQYLVKLRLHGKAGDLNLQNRWAADGDEWRIVEIEDLGLRSPWKKPEAIAAGAEKERAH
jgi:hypothetical protein